MMAGPVVVGGRYLVYLPTDLPVDGNLRPMQYTGLKDENGVEIYEGDIVSTNYSEFDLGAVEFADFEYRLCHHSLVMPMRTLWGNDWTFEVVGNIYQNPEQLS
jgi:hypothetical protein